ncbi:putative Golgi membrane protein [Neofusicoccum parvum]|uniref:Protein YIP n=3 Tax=Neofusicoccum TaxID=407951 RepID=R1EFJ8_BOTPV|nr:putative golgi membrane protein [Neofusicoccum parvum UCRNP2]GME25566.1 putative Golgi membrane protein [Neofusicoccum parvum]GME64741.1 putative Golgi membrane protein [Neofusicoccum parvum]
MANYYGASPNAGASGAYGQPAAASAQNLNFYQSSYSQQPVSGHTTPFQAYNGGAVSSAYAGAGFGGAGSMAGPSGFGGAVPGVSGRMGEQGGLRTGWLAAFGTEGYEGEPPLLEELGVNFGHIKTKTLTVLNPLARIDQHIMDDSDLAGPILFFLLFGTFLLFSGKVHFGYIYGLALLGSTSLHMILSLMSPPVDSATAASGHPSHPTSSHFSSTLTFPRSASVLGYCLLPLVLTSLVGIAIPMDGPFGYILTTAAILWCTYSSSAMFCAVGRMSGMRGLVAYPLGLFYVGFGIMAIFSSRGTGSLAAKTAVGGA